MIRLVTLDDAAAIAAIYNYYVENTTVSFEEVPLAPEDMERRIRKVTETARFPWLVAEENGAVNGYAYLSPWKERVSYRYTAEVSIYLRAGCEGRGLGSRLMKRLLEAAETRALHVLTACIALPNAPSAGLHEKFGFKKAGHFHEAGFKLNQWVDVGDWELLLHNKA